jgi:hypothetical protein
VWQREQSAEALWTLAGITAAVNGVPNVWQDSHVVP